MIVEYFLLGWLLGGFVANVITMIVQKAIQYGNEVENNENN